MRKQTPAPPPRSRRPTPAGVILGRAAFARISAVEGIALTPEMRALLDGFDREGLSAEERRARIAAQFQPLAKCTL